MHHGHVGEALATERLLDGLARSILHARRKLTKLLKDLFFGLRSNNHTFIFTKSAWFRTAVKVRTGLQLLASVARITDDVAV